MKTKHYLLFAATVCIIIYACRKMEGNSPSEKYADAIEWLKQNGGNYKSQKMMAKLPDSTIATGKLDWSKTVYYTVNNQNYIEIPFIFDKIGENVPTNGSGAYTHFRIVMRAVNNTFDAALQVTMLNTAVTRISDNQKLTAAFQTYYTLTGKPINAYMRPHTASQVESIIVTRAAPGAVQNKSITGIGSAGGGSGAVMAIVGGGEDCDTEVSIEWESSDYWGSDGTYYVYDFPVTVTDIVCKEKTFQQDPGEGEGSGGSAGGGSGNFPPNLPNNDDNMEKPDTIAIDQSIINNYPCLNAIIDTIMTAGFNNNSNLCYQIINQIFGESKTFTLNFKVNSSSPDANAYTAAPDITASGDYFGTTIFFQSSYVSKATVPSMAGTLFHELIHAYLDYKFTLFVNNSDSIKSLVQEFSFFGQDGLTQGISDASLKANIIDTYQNSYGEEDYQHNVMADNYVSVISSAIAQFDSYRQSTDYYNALAWGGLLQTDAWKALPSQGIDTTKIHDTIYNEQEGNPQSIGQKCH